MSLFKTEVKVKLNNLLVEIENLMIKLKSHAKNLITKFIFSLIKKIEWKRLPPLGFFFFCKIVREEVKISFL